MIDEQRRRGVRIETLGADKAYDTRDFVADLRDREVTPHISQRKRKLVEEIFGWMKTIGGLRKTRYRGKRRNRLWAYVNAAAYNLVRLVRMAPAT